MKVVVRVDASLQIGTGHVMRCLTLANALKKQGAEIEFICRAHQGNLIEHIEQQGCKTHALPMVNTLESTQAKWLGSTQQQDAEYCKPVLDTIKPDWLIVDHYAIDQTWQLLLKESYKKLMVIDDLADRKQNCDILLDQTFGRKPEEYTELVPKYCQMLLGSKYALLRPEFAQWRDYSLQRRGKPEFKKILITMGGVDLDNVTGQVLEALKKCGIPKITEITVVMGVGSPHIEHVKKQAEEMPCKTQVKVNVRNMAEIMANADLAIGAAGATTWERCCLGLPSIQIVLAKNQKLIAEIVNKAGAAVCLEVKQLNQICKQIGKAQSRIENLIINSSRVTNGTGVIQVLRYLK